MTAVDRRFAALVQDDGTSIVVDGDSGERLARLPRVDAANYARRLNLVEAIGPLVRELVGLEGEDPAVQALADAFDTYRDELRTEGRLACPECGSPDPFRCDRPGEPCDDRR